MIVVDKAGDGGFGDEETHLGFWFALVLLLLFRLSWLGCVRVDNSALRWKMNTFRLSRYGFR